MKLFKIRNGNGKDEVVDTIYSLDDEKSWDVKITKKRWSRSISQNNLYWLWLTCIEQETGTFRDELHDFFKAKFLGFEEIEVFGRIVTKVKSTTSLDTLQFTNYLDKIQVFASVELGIKLPIPQDKYWSDFYETYKYLM